METTALTRFAERVASASETILKEEGAVPAHFILAIGDRLEFLPLDMRMMGDYGYKAAACKTLRHFAEMHDASHYAFVTEAWMATMGPGETPGEGRRPSEREDRIEALVVIGGAPGEPFHVIREILRDETGKVVGLGTPRDYGAAGIGGLFAGLLDTDPVAVR